MFRKSGRKFVKRALSLSKVKILYSRITLTRFTTAYFFLALFACLALTILQILTYVENSAAVSVLEPLHDLPDMGIVMVEDNKLLACTSLPTASRKECRTVVIYRSDRPSNKPGNQTAVTKRSQVLEMDLSKRATDGIVISELSQQCILSLKWLDDLLHDAKREDLVNLAFNIWLFILALTTVVNESIPHLVASLLGHVLGTGWSAFRVYSTRNLMDRYKTHIVPRACGGVDLLKGWWDYRIQHAIPNTVINGVTLIAYAYLSFCLFKIYANQTFSRFGASSQIHRMYKVVLVFLVCLQLSGFFSLASTALWIDKICHGAVQRFAIHQDLYLAAFIITLVMQLPWFILGWFCVRKECKIRFGIFIVIAILLLAVSTAMFFSPLYRYIFVTWPFFTTVTCTAYLLVLTTTVLSIVCRLNFGKGLAHYFQVTEALDGVDFTPVFFSKGGDVEKPLESAGSKTSYLNLPPLTYQNNSSRKSKTFSFHSQGNTSPIQLFATKPLMSDLGVAPERLTTRNRLSKAPPNRSTSLTRRSRAFEQPVTHDFVVADSGVPPPAIIVPPTEGEPLPSHPPGLEIVAAINPHPASVPKTTVGHPRGLPNNPRGRGRL